MDRSQSFRFSAVGIIPPVLFTHSFIHLLLRLSIWRRPWVNTHNDNCIYYSCIRASQYDSVEITNKMQPWNIIYYSTVHWRLNIFRTAHRSSSGALTVFAASGLHTHVVTGCSQVWVGRSLKAQHVLSGTPLIIRSSNFICSVWFTYACGDRP
jgi:hypothetical protein